MSYHKIKIPKGTIGEFSKIEEEFLELKDGFDQKDKILQSCELSDLIGAIELYSEKHLNRSLNDIIKFKNKTRKAFESGSRSSEEAYSLTEKGDRIIINIQNNLIFVEVENSSFKNIEELKNFLEKFFSKNQTISVYSLVTFLLHSIRKKDLGFAGVSINGDVIINAVSFLPSDIACGDTSILKKFGGTEQLKNIIHEG